MFRTEELIAKYPLFVESTTPIESVLFEPNNFPSSSSEETISICRGLKSDFESPIHFWIRAQQCVDWTGREEYFLPYLHTAVCRQIEEQDFIEILN
jgi:hypothetical protein